MPVQVDGDGVTVEPDLRLLLGEDTVYPVYIDPSVGLGVSERTVLSSDGDKFWQFNGDYGVGRCSKLAGKYVLDATFRAYETWSFSCSVKWVDLERTNNISEGTRWPGPTLLDQMGDRPRAPATSSPTRPPSTTRPSGQLAEVHQDTSRRRFARTSRGRRSDPSTSA
ncbi:hypothetical protein [Streptomyces parvulus]|uniref:hypothetical protein n=1 Tax=Streptomyces parvulus TaxID=146923 RepID=UPI003EBD1295